MNARLFALVLAATPTFVDVADAATRHHVRAEDRQMYAHPSYDVAPGRFVAPERAGGQDAAPANFDPLTSSNANGS